MSILEKNKGINQRYDFHYYDTYDIKIKMLFVQTREFPSE